MSRREYNIPVHIHKENTPGPKKKNNLPQDIEYIEKKEQLAGAEHLTYMKEQKQASPKPQEMNEDFADNVMQGLIDHQNQAPRPELGKKDKRHVIMWLGVAIFILIILVVWIFGLRSNFMNITDQLNQSDESETINSFSEKFSESLDVLKSNLKDFDNIKEELETEQTKQQAVDNLKDKIEDQQEEKSLPIPEDTEQ